MANSIQFHPHEPYWLTVKDETDKVLYREKYGTYRAAHDDFDHIASVYKCPTYN